MPRRKKRPAAARVARTDEVMEFIKKFKRDHDGNSPTRRDIMHAVGLRSTSAVNYHLAILEKDNRITHVAGKNRMGRIAVVGGRWSMEDDDNGL